MQVDVKIDAETVNKMVTDAIMGSVIGDRLTEIVKTEHDASTMTAEAMAAQMGTTIEGLAKNGKLKTVERIKDAAALSQGALARLRSTNALQRKE